ncbi:AAA family ATPase [Candidatus Puniceispirillum sp.]|nr:AAA family ATPase [Candidatus Puniceispirillum sp.]
MNHREKIDPSLVIGHNVFFDMLNKLVVNGQMHHAWLFTGPRGIGKASVARLAAAWLLSEQDVNSSFFGAETGHFSVSVNDPGANQVFNGAHPDFLSISPNLDDNKSGQIKIDQIRNMIPFMAHKPSRGRWRVVLIDSMDEVNRNGANAMLKFLEEPPENVVIFLISSRPGQLPSTIRSRCRVFRFSSLEESLCRSVLTTLLPKTDPENIDFLSKLSAGAPGRAVCLADSGALECYQVACSLIISPKLDVSAMSALTGKWGRGSAVGFANREGAVFCLERLLRLSALTACSGNTLTQCAFETRAISVLCDRHSPVQLAMFHDKFLQDSARAERLYLDFSQFLLRHMIKLHEKTLP